MSYPEIVKQVQEKVAKYNVHQCMYALSDCHATLALWKEETDYTRKLWAEVDALRDRIREVNRAA